VPARRSIDEMSGQRATDYPTSVIMRPELPDHSKYLSDSPPFRPCGLFARSLCPSANVLIGARAFLTVAASMMMPATLSLLCLTFTTDKERGQAIGMWAAVFSVASQSDR
jgi:hypothetical protein